MWPPDGGRGVVFALLLALAACSAQNAEDRLDPLGLIPPPPTIAAADAGQHVGELVVVRTRIASARVAKGQALLEPEGVEPGRFVISIAPPVIGPTARDLAAEYDGQEVRAVGYISDLGNDLELLIGDPDRIRLADVSDAMPAESASSNATVAPEGSVVESASATAAAADPERAAASAATVPVAAAATPDPACENARRAWRIAASDARAPLRELLECLDAGEPRCKNAAARARVALAEVAASEERLRWVCGGGS